MTTIDIWSAATTRDSSFSSWWYTLIDLNNSANKDWKIDTREICALTNMSGITVASFYLDSGTTYKSRSSATLWSAASWAKRTFTWLNISVKQWDFIWIYWTWGILYATTAWNNWYWYASGDW
jgi:hypothetical protein